MFSDAETENTFQSHLLRSDPVPYRLLERQKCKQSHLQYNLQKPQCALWVAKTLGLVIYKHWQRSRGAFGCDGWTRMPRCGWGMGPRDGRDQGGELPSGERGVNYPDACYLLLHFRLQDSCAAGQA